MARALKSIYIVAAVLCLLTVGIVPGEAQTTELPVLLVHGFCSDSGTFSDMIASLVPSARYGSVVTRLYAGRSVQSSPTLVAFAKDTGVPATSAFTVDASRRLFTIDFYDDVNRSFDQTLVNDTGISHKGAELAVVVKEVARITGSSRVIVVGHSLGGLAARAYVQGLAATAAGALTYGGEVPKIVTIDTPHTGANTSTFGFVSGLSQCIIETSADKTDLTPSSSFLTQINSTSRLIPGTTDVSAIISWDRAFGRSFGDFVVNGTQQSLATVPAYVNAANVRDWTNEITTGYTPSVLHIAIHHLAQTITLVRSLITSFDSVTPSVPGAPTVLTNVSGTSTVTLFWNAPASGASVSSYVIEAGSASGASDLAVVDNPGTGTTFSASNIPAGTYFVRVRAKNAAGVSAPSNELVLTFGSSSCSAVGAPTNLSGSVSGSTVTLNWSAPSGTAPTAYLLEAGSGPGLSNLASFDYTNSTSFTTSGVAAGTYFVRVRSKNSCSVSAASNEVIVTVR